MPAANLSDELPILRAFYDLVLWLLPKWANFRANIDLRSDSGSTYCS